MVNVTVNPRLNVGGIIYRTTTCLLGDAANVATGVVAGVAADVAVGVATGIAADLATGVVAGIAADVAEGGCSFHLKNGTNPPFHVLEFVYFLLNFISPGFMV